MIANIAGPGEMPHIVSSHLGLQCKFNQAFSFEDVSELFFISQQKYMFWVLKRIE